MLKHVSSLDRLKIKLPFFDVEMLVLMFEKADVLLFCPQRWPSQIPVNVCFESKTHECSSFLYQNQELSYRFVYWLLKVQVGLEVD